MNYKNIITFAFSLIVSIYSIAQCSAPVVNNFSPLSAATGTMVTINGSNFDATAANNIVYFGAAKATPLTASINQLLVKVPLGATFNYLTVTNKACNLTGYSKDFFSPISVCPGTFDASTVDTRLDFISPDPQYGPYAILFGDFDLDGKTDVVYPTAFTTTAPIVIARNQSVPGLIDLSSTITIGAGAGAAQARNMAIADVDGDGRLDIITVDGSSSVRILKNISSGPGNFAFAPAVVYTTNSGCYQVSSNDIDGDGRPDLAIGHFSSSFAAIFRNTSVPGTISFAAKQDVNISGYSIALADLNGDNKVDLLTGNGSLNVCRSTSTPGTISFMPVQTFTGGSGGYRIAVGDLNGDGKNDVAIANGNVGIYRNTTSGGSLSFVFSTINTASTGYSRVAISDLNADGKPDIMACGSGDNKVACALNSTTTTGGAISFSASPVVLTGTGCQYALGTADIDGDGNNDVLSGDWCSNRRLNVFRNNVLGLIPVTNSVSPTTGLVCNSTITINYSAQCNGANPGNVYTAQLSDANGNFSVPINIGSVTTTSSGTITGTIPSCIASGTGYRIRVVGSDPNTSGTVFSTPLSINCQTIAPASITTSAVDPAPYCSGTAINVPYTANGSFGVCESNTFTAQLSDASGSFASPVNIGSITSNASGTISGIIPTTTLSGTSYRIRVVSDQPLIVGTNNGNNITIINNCNAAPVAVCNPVTVSAGPNCLGNAAAIDFNNGSTDADGDALSFSVSPAGPYTIGTTSVTLTVTDPKGASSTCTTTITVSDNQKPRIVGLPANINKPNDPNTCGAVVSWTEPTASDNCAGSSISQIAGLASGSTFAVGTHAVMYKVIDAAGNFTTDTFTITVTDNQNPFIAVLADVNINSVTGECWAHNILATPIPTDNCGIASITSNAPAIFTVGSHTVTWTATDIHGNITTAMQKVKVIDWQKPTISAPANLNINADNGSCTASGVVLSTPVTADNCGIAITTNNAPATYPVGTTIVAWTATDIHGNSSTATQMVTVVDNQDPSITAPADLNINVDNGRCTASGIALGTPLTTDNCGVATITNNKPSTYPVGSTTVTWTVTDINGRTATATQTVTVTDSQKPVIITNGNKSVGSDAGICGAAVTVSATATDNCSVGIPTGVRSDGLALNATYRVGVTTITWNVTDANGVAALPVTQTVRVIDSAKPVITTNGHKSVNNDPGICGAAVVVNATATDNCTVGMPTGVRSDGLALNAVYPVGTTTITWNVKDTNGLPALPVTQTIIVKDVTRPALSIPAAVVINAPVGACNIQASAINIGTASATDNCSGIISISNNAPVMYSLGTTAVTWTATDAAGNKTMRIQQVIVKSNQPPVLNAPASITRSTDPGQCGAVVTLGIPTATAFCTNTECTRDNIDSYSAGVVSGQSAKWIVWPGETSGVVTGSKFFSAPNSVRFTNHQDQLYLLGNKSSGNWVLSWKMFVPAGKTAYYNTQQFETAGIYWGQQVQFGSNGTGVLQAEGAYTPFGYPQGQWFDVNQTFDLDADQTTLSINGVAVKTWQYSKQANNVPGAKQLGSIDFFAITANFNNSEPNPAAVPEFYVDDISFCGGNNPVVSAVRNDTLPLSSAYPVGTTTVTWTATDASGLTTTATQKITINDNQAPVVITKPVTVILDANGQGTITASQVDNGSNDACGIKEISVSKSSFDCSNIGANTVTLTVIDKNGNVSTGTAIVTVKDVTPPVITLIGSGASPDVLWPANNKMVDVAVKYTSTDNCSSTCTITNIKSNEPVNGNGVGNTAADWEIVDNKKVRLRAERLGTGDGRTYTVTITCTDPSGNKSTQDVKVFVPKNQSSNGITQANTEGRVVEAEPLISSKIRVAVYPNPTTSRFTLRLENFKSSKAEVIIMNAVGAVVDKKPVQLQGAEQLVSFDLGNKAPGIYLVKVVSEDGVKSASVLLQR